MADPSRYDVRRPRVSATTPVGTSKSTWPAVKKALAAKASVMLRPASSRNSVLMPQMKRRGKRGQKRERDVSPQNLRWGNASWPPRGHRYQPPVFRGNTGESPVRVGFI